MLKFHVRLTPTKDEIVDGLERARLRRAGKGRLIAQAAALVLVAAWSFAAFFGDGMNEPMSAVIGIAALVLIPVMWLVPRWQMNSLAQSMADSGASPQMWVFEDGIDFGEEQPAYEYYTYHTFFVSLPDETTQQTMVLKFPNDDVIIVPKALLSDEQWAFLTEKVTTAPAKKTEKW